jgi:hypothetical protein
MSKFRRLGLGILTTAFLFTSCASYERASIDDIRYSPKQYTGRNVEVQGSMLDPNDGYLYAGTPMASIGIKTNCYFPNKRAEKLSDILQGRELSDINRTVIKGNFTNNEILEVKSGFVDINGHKFKF